MSNEGGQPIFEINIQVIPNLWNVSQNDQTVHSCASLLSCYLCQLSLWVRPLQKIKCPQNNKMLGSDPILFQKSIGFARFHIFVRASAPPILFGHTIGGCRTTCNRRNTANHTGSTSIQLGVEPQVASAPGFGFFAHLVDLWHCTQ